MQSIEHLIVLVLENRSFDHMLGSLRMHDSRIDGPLDTDFNYRDPSAKAGLTYVTFDAPYIPDVDPGPGHDFQSVLTQLFMGTQVPNPIEPGSTNSGFVYDYRSVCKGVGQSDALADANAGSVMRCFRPGALPALHTLANEFAICDHWFSSLPGPTMPNRLFMHCATSGGFLDDNATRQYGMRTIFQNLSQENVNWRVYYHSFPPLSLALVHQRQYFASKYETFDGFLDVCKSGLLPQYSFIEPRYYPLGADRANDQHPIHGVPLGDDLIADVYEALHASPLWEKSLLLITWDEHGGFYDHVLPKQTVNPDATAPAEFDFALLGVRVPAVVVSPYVPRGTVDPTAYDHSSICATVKKIFGLPGFLTRRDAQAKTFEGLASLGEPRADVPIKLTRIPANAREPVRADAPATELHASLTALAESLADPSAAPKSPPITEREAAERSRAAFEVYRAKGPQ